MGKRTIVKVALDVTSRLICKLLILILKLIFVLLLFEFEFNFIIVFFFLKHNLNSTFSVSTHKYFDFANIYFLLL